MVPIRILRALVEAEESLARDRERSFPKVEGKILGVVDVTRSREW